MPRRSSSPYDRAAMRRAVSLSSIDDTGDRLGVRVDLAAGTVLPVGAAHALARELARIAELAAGPDSPARPSRSGGRAGRRRIRAAIA